MKNNWQGINEIISNIQKKGGLKKKFQLSMLKDFLKKNYGVDEIVFRGNKLEIKTGSSVFAQELFLKREKIKEGLNRILSIDAKKRGEAPELIKEIIVWRR